MLKYNSRQATNEKANLRLLDRFSVRVASLFNMNMDGYCICYLVYIISLLFSLPSFISRILYRSHNIKEKFIETCIKIQKKSWKQWEIDQKRRSLRRNSLRQDISLGK